MPSRVRLNPTGTKPIKGVGDFLLIASKA